MSSVEPDSVWDEVKYIPKPKAAQVLHAPAATQAYFDV